MDQFQETEASSVVVPNGLAQERNYSSSTFARQVWPVLSRLIPGLFFFAAVRGKVAELIAFTNHAANNNEALSNLSFFVSVGSRVSVILFLGLMAILFIVRDEPIRKAAGIAPRLAAIAGTFLMSALTFFPRADLDLPQLIGATLLVLIGTSLSAFVLFRLGRSFSLMAEARRLVTTGPYAIVRHPLYLAEEIAIVGTLLQFLSPYTILVFAIHLGIQIQRMNNEEKVLQLAFPDYAQYQARTSRLIPGLY